MANRTTLVFPADAHIAVVQRRGMIGNDGKVAWITGPQWQRDTHTDEIIAVYDRSPPIDELEMCMAACRRRTA